MEQINLRAKYEAQYARARANLLLMAVLTAINVVLLIIEADISFLFSAMLPQLTVFYGWLLEGLTYSAAFTWIGYIVAAILIGLYLLCYFMSKKRRGWMTAALVLFVVDCLALVYWIYLGAMAEDLIDVAFHIWIMVYLVTGVVAASKLNKLPETQPMEQPMAPPMPENFVQPPVQPIQPEVPIEAEAQEQPEAPIEAETQEQPEAPAQAEAQEQPEAPAQTEVQEQPEAPTQAEAQEQAEAPAQVLQPEEADGQPDFGPQQPMGPQSIE